MAMKRKHARSQKSWRPLLVSVQGWPDMLPQAEAAVLIPLGPYAEKSPTTSTHKISFYIDGVFLHLFQT